jgi:TetR/AcrR family transcriptional regulator
MKEAMRDAERSKNKILDSAEQLFATKGFNNTSLGYI